MTEQDIRSDLWPTMTIDQLNVQRELILNKLNLLYTIPKNHSIINIIGALTQAAQDIDTLLDARITSNRNDNNDSIRY